jgi:protein SCO1/2
VKIKTFSFITCSVLLLSACGTAKAPTGMSHSSSTKVMPGSAAAGGGSYLDETIPADVLSLKLLDQDGKSFTLASLKGKYLVITNFLTSCQEICPMTTANMRTIGDAVAASALKEQVKVIEISVDARRDIPSRLAAYRAMYNDSNFTLASGTEADLKTLWTYFGAPAMRMEFSAKEKAALPLDWQTGKPSGYDMSHSDLVTIVGPDGHWKWLDLGNPNPGKATIPEKLKKFLSEDGLNNLAKPQEPSWSVEAVYSALHDLTGTLIS